MRTLVRAVPWIGEQGQVPIVPGLGEAPQLDTEFNAIDNYLSLRQAGVTPYTFGTPSSAGGARRIGDVARELRSRFSDSDFKPIYQTEDGAIYPKLEALTKSVISDRLEKIQLEIVDPDDRARLNSSDKRTQQEFQQALKLASDLLDKADIGKAQDPIAATKEFLGRLKKIKESEGFLLHGLAVPFNKVQTPRQRGLLLDAISIIERSNLYSAPGLGQIGSKIQKTTAKGLGNNVAGETLRAGLTDLANIALQSAGTALMPATGGMSLPAFYGLSVLTNLGLNAPSYEQEQALRIEILLSQARATGAILSDDGRDILNVTPIEGEQFVLNAPLPFKATKELKDVVGGKLGAGGIGYRKTGQSTLNVGVSDWNTLPPGTVLSRLDVLKLSDAMYAAVPYKPAKTLDFDRVEERATFYLGAERGNSIVPNPWDNIQRYNADSEASTYLEMLSANQGSPLRQAIINAMSTQFIGKTVANFQPGVTRAKNFVFDPVQGLVSLYKTAAGPGSNLITGAVNQLLTGWTNGVTRLVNVSTQTANEIKFKRATFPASFRPYFERLAEVQQSTGLKIENDTVQAVANSGDTKVYAALTQLIERFAQNSAEAEAAGLKNQLQVDMNQAARDIAGARVSPEYLIRNLENTNLKLNQILDITDDRRAVYEAYTSVPDDIPGTLRQRINILKAYYERRGRPQSQLDKLDRLTTQQLSDLVMRFTGLPLPQSLESNNNTLSSSRVPGGVIPGLIGAATGALVGAGTYSLLPSPTQLNIPIPLGILPQQVRKIVNPSGASGDLRITVKPSVPARSAVSLIPTGGSATSVPSGARVFVGQRETQFPELTLLAEIDPKKYSLNYNLHDSNAPFDKNNSIRVNGPHFAFNSDGVQQAIYPQRLNIADGSSKDIPGLKYKSFDDLIPSGEYQGNRQVFATMDDGSAYVGPINKDVIRKAKTIITGLSPTQVNTDARNNGANIIGLTEDGNLVLLQTAGDLEGADNKKVEDIGRAYGVRIRDYVGLDAGSSRQASFFGNEVYYTLHVTRPVPYYVTVTAQNPGARDGELVDYRNSRPGELNGLFWGLSGGLAGALAAVRNNRRINPVLRAFEDLGAAVNNRFFSSGPGAQAPGFDNPPEWATPELLTDLVARNTLTPGQPVVPYTSDLQYLGSGTRSTVFSYGYRDKDQVIKAFNEPLTAAST
ncbi:MAG: hypothetical protein ACK50W_00005, partial [bacterium]